ncbi:MAG: RNA-binding protein [Verrucomicrobia bacterium]|nr:RNA-binding protein [Verrucomicrobiota bacterium]
MATTLYIGNLSFQTTEQDLQDEFSKCGKVVRCQLILDKFTGKSRGFAFVEMSSQEEANKAVAEMNGKDLGGRQLRVNEARPREERPPRRDMNGGGGGGGGGRGDRDGGRRGGGRRDFGRDR